MEISHKLEKFDKILSKKMLRTFCRKFVEKFSEIFGIILVTFLENLLIFCCGGGARGELKKMLKMFWTLKDNFLRKFKKYFVHVVEKISENEYILEEIWRWF